MTRKVKKIVNGRFTTDGAGVRLKRVFGHGEVPLFDPFLMLDEFGSTDPDEYMRGFPWHPHRGIETVTYLLEGTVEHGDSIGNKGEIADGQCQWMSAGSGIIHQEMPKRSPRLRGLQLWVNMAAADKMSDPVYRDVRADEIVSVRQPGVDVKVIAGTWEGAEGPIRGIRAQPSYFDVTLAPGATFSCPSDPDHTVFCYTLEGDGAFDDGSGPTRPAGCAILFERGDRTIVKAGPNGLRFVYLSGKPFGEPVAWGGPIVMNTEEELDAAFRELDAGTFIKKKK